MKRQQRHIFDRLLLSLGASLGISAAAHAGAFLSGTDLVVARMGEGVTNYAGKGAPVFLDEYDVSGASPVLKNTVAFNSSGAAALTESYSVGGRDGYLILSPNSQFLTFAGYRKDAGGTDPAGDTSATTPRVVGIVGQNGVPDTSTALDYASATNFRSAVTTDGNSIWVTGNGSGPVALAHTTKGSTGTNYTTINATGAAGWRVANIAGGQLYGGTGSTPKGVYSISDSITSSPLPTGANAASQTLLTGDSSSEPVLLDLDATVPGVDTMYVSGSGSFNKYSLVSGAWVSNGSIADGDNITGVAAMKDGSNVDLFYSTDKGVYKFLDGGYNTAFSGSLPTAYITPGTNENFRGIAFAPVPEPGSLGMIGLAGCMLLRRRKGAR